MRKLLLATTALAGAALFADAAQAGMEVTVSGYNDFRAGFFGQTLSNATPRRHMDFENEYQLEVEAKGKANNGMEYGAVGTLWNGDGGVAINTHQAYTYVNGSWGQIKLGDHHGGLDLATSAPTFYDFGGQVDGYYTEFLSATEIFTIKPTYMELDQNDTNITYLTPVLGANGHKIVAGATYVPNMSMAAATRGRNVTWLDNASYKDVFEAGAKYMGSFMDKVNVTASGIMWTGSKTTAGLRDFTAYDLGAQVGYAGFTVGGNYTDAGRMATAAGQDKEQDVWTVGASYKFDRASVAGSYLSGQGYNLGGGVYSESYTAWGIGAGYSLFDGMITSVDATFFEQDRAGAAMDSEGHVVILSNRVAF